MKIRPNISILFIFVILIGLTTPVESVNADGNGLPMEFNYSVPDVVSAFDNLTDQGEWLGYHMSSDVSELDFSDNASRHNQGIARSPRIGPDQPPVFYIPHSGKGLNDNCEQDDVEYPGIMVAEFHSRPKDGERLRSNRLRRGTVTTNSEPDEDDDLINSLIDEMSHHPSGVQMVGDILAVPSGGRIFFYNCMDTNNPEMVEMPLSSTNSEESDIQAASEECEHPDASAYFSLLIKRDGCPENGDNLTPEQRKDCHGCQGVGITRMPAVKEGNEIITPSRILLITNDNYGAHLHWSNGEPFFMMDNSQEDPELIKNPGFAFVDYQFIPLDEIKDKNGNLGYWPTRKTDTKMAQSLSLVDEIDENGDYSLFLIGACNSDVWSPTSIGEDQLYLLEIENPQTPGEAKLVGLRKEINKTLLNPGPLSEIAKRYNGNLNAGGGAYVSPSGELIYYGVSHWNDGPGNSVKIAELRHKDVFRPGSPAYALRADAGGPYEVNEGDTIKLNGNLCQPALAAPWVQLFDDTSFKGQSVMVDYDDRDSDDYDQFSKLDEEPLLFEGNLCLDEEKKAELTYKLDAFSKWAKELGKDDFFEKICLGYEIDGVCYITPPVADEDDCKQLCDDAYEPVAVACRLGKGSCPSKWTNPIGYAACRTCIEAARAVKKTCKNACKVSDGVVGPMITVPWVDVGVWTVFEDTLDIVELLIENIEAYQLCGRLLDFELNQKVPMPEFTFLQLDSWGFDPAQPENFNLSDQVIESRINAALKELEDYIQDLIDLWNDILLSMEGFNNMASSVRWYAPVGVDITLHEKALYGGVSKLLAGTGSVEEIADLSSWHDRARSVKFNGDFSKQTIASYDWSFLDPAPSDLFIENPISVTPTVDAANANGPMQVEVMVTVSDTKAATASATASVNVLNVAPQVEIDRIEDYAGKIIEGDVPMLFEALAYRLFGSFTDPGVQDTHTAKIAWGDGMLNLSGDGVLELNDSVGGVAGSVEVLHTYAGKGNYTILFTVEDDAGDANEASMDVQVVNALGATEFCVEKLIALLGNKGLAANVEKAIFKALSILRGNQDGGASNGVLDKLEGGQTNAALDKIVQTLGWLDYVADRDPSLAGEVEAFQRLLALSAKSVAMKAITEAEILASKKNDQNKIENAFGFVSVGDVVKLNGDFIAAAKEYTKAFRAVQGII